MMIGLELILSNVCLNATQCDAQDRGENPLRTAKSTVFKSLEQEISGKHLRVGTIESYPMTYFESGEDGSAKFSGVVSEIVNTLAKKFNFTYEVVLPSKNWEGYGPRLEDSLLGLVNSSGVDFGAAFLPVTNDPEGSVIYSVSLDEGSWVMMMVRPKESAVGSGLLAPFNNDVWYVRTATHMYITLVAVIAYGPCIWLLAKFRHWLTKIIHWHEKDKPLYMSSVVWFVYGAFVKQGSTMEPDANTTRILFATWWLFTILINAFYTANLTAFLTLSKFTLEINEPTDLLKKNHQWFAKEGAAMEYIISDPGEELYYLNRMVKADRGRFALLQDDESFLKSISSGQVFLNDQPAVDVLMYEDYLRKTRAGIEEKSKCTFVVSPKPILKRVRAFVFPLNSTLPILFNPTLQALKEGGLIYELENYRLPRAKICPLDLNSTERRLRNSDLLMTYICGLIGTAAAIATFIVEIVTKRIKSKRFDPNSKEVKTEKRSTSWKKKKYDLFDPRLDPSPPPPYESLFQLRPGYSNEIRKKKFVNGREYWEVETISGDIRLIPVRTPSALLFQRSKKFFK